MSKYKVGDKIILMVTDTNEMGCLPCYVLNDDLILSRQEIDKYSEPLSTYTLPLEAKIRRQAEEITRLLAENERLKKENETMSVKIDCYELYGDQHEEEYNQAFNQGAEAAWELVRKIGNMPCDAAEEIFGIDFIFDLVRNDTYQEVAAKVAEWEKAKEEIKVGDIYESNIGSRCFAIRNIDEETNNVEILWIDLASGNRAFEEIKKNYTKTGRHIDIDSFLKQIGEEQDE